MEPQALKRNVEGFNHKIQSHVKMDSFGSDGMTRRRKIIAVKCTRKMLWKDELDRATV